MLLYESYIVTNLGIPSVPVYPFFCFQDPALYLSRWGYAQLLGDSTGTSALPLAVAVDSCYLGLLKCYGAREQTKGLFGAQELVAY